MRFLGKPHMDGWVDPDSTEGWKPLCMMAYLCVNLPLQLHTDTELAELLWPRLPLSRGQRRVDEAAQMLNRSFEDPIIEVTRYGEYRVIQPAVSVDLWIFRGGVRMQRYDDALTLYRGELLEGIDLPDAPEFMAWLGRQRTKYNRLATLCAWRSHEKSASDDEPYLAAGLAALAHHHSPDPAPLVARVMTSLRSVGANEDATRIFNQTPNPPDEAVRLAHDSGDGSPRKPRRSYGRLRVVVFGASLLLAAVFAVPRLLPDSGAPDTTIPMSSPESREAQPRAGSPPATRDPLLPPSRPAPPPSPEAIWDLANRQLDHGAFDEARALFRLLLGHPRFGEAANTRSLLAWSASPSDSTLPGSAATEGESAGRAARALALLRQGRPVEAGELLPPPGPDTRGLSWLARIYVAAYTADARLGDWVEAAPDTVFAPTEGRLSKRLFLGWMLASEGDSAGARTYFEEAEREARAALAERPDDPWRHLDLARALTALRDTSRARAALAAGGALREDPDVLLRFKTMEARALLTAPGSESRRILTDSLLEARYPWSLDSLQLRMDPRWQPTEGSTSAPADPST